MKRLLIICFLLLNFATFSQGKKNGYVKVFLDEQLYPVDSIVSSYYAYDLYDNGVKVFTFSNRGKEWKNFVLYSDGKALEKGKPILLEGNFKWLDDQNRVQNEEVYKAGKPFFWKSHSYYKNGDEFNEVLYFDRLFNNTVGTFYWEEYSTGSPVRKYWFRKGNRGWRSYRIKDMF